jgi:hypothetical protein
MKYTRILPPYKRGDPAPEWKPDKSDIALGCAVYRAIYYRGDDGAVMRVLTSSWASEC